LFQALSSQGIVRGRGRGNGDSIKPGKHSPMVGKVLSPIQIGDLPSTCLVQIGQADQLDTRQVGTDSAVSLAHNASADDTYTYNSHDRSPP
jgi:hypothetical protein